MINKILFVSLLMVAGVKCELFSAIAGLESMLHTEKDLLQHSSEYISKLEDTLNYFQNTHRKLAEKNNHSKMVRDQKLGSQFDSFMIAKRLLGRSDWNRILNLTTENNELTNYINTIENIKEKGYPSYRDLNGAAVALARLQQTYQLNVTNLARGQIKNIQSSEMSALDCFDVGFYVYETKKYYLSAIWFETALTRLAMESNPDRDVELIILRNLLKVYFKEKNYKAAQIVNNQILAISPVDEESAANKEYIKLYMERNRASLTELRNFDEQIMAKRIVAYENPMEHIVNPMFSVDSLYEDRLYEAVCRGDITPPPKQLASLRCRYVTNKAAFLTIAPFKLEEVALEPYIVVYHDVIYDKEIEIVKSLSEPRLQRAGVTTQDDPSTERISKSAFLGDHTHKVIADISTRVADMTMLSMSAAEELQIVNYGIGGFYNLHYDFAVTGDTTFDEMAIGNRVATVLFYMTDVTFGGATAFPLLKRAVFPKKGTAVFWWNLHKSGVRDLRTMHAGCPVLVGSKWVSNKWIHVHHQELLQPCGLKPDHPIGQVDD